MSFQTFDERIALMLSSSIAPADTTTVKSFWVADAQVRRIDAMLLSSTDTSDRVVQVSVNLGGADQPLFEVTIPAGAGHGVVPAVEVLATVAFANLPGLILPASGVLRWNCTTTVTTAKALTGIVQGGIF
jgi:hypothetical protein